MKMVSELKQSKHRCIRNALLLLAVSLSLLVIGGANHYRVEVEAHRENLERQERLAVNQAHLTLSKTIERVTSDISFLTEYSEKIGIPVAVDDIRAVQLADHFEVFSRQNGVYDQIRLLDTTGQEVVRINYNDGNPVKVARAELQNKSDRYYFSKGLELRRGEIFISPIDVNIEWGKPEQLPQPMFRIASPVFDGHGRKRGVLLLNFYGKTLSKEFKRTLEDSADNIMLIDDHGYWLSSPKSDQEWGFVYGHEQRFLTTYPETWKYLRESTKGHYYSKEGLFTFSTLFPEKEITRHRSRYNQTDISIQDISYFWKVVSFIPHSMINTPINFIRFVPAYLLLFMALLLVVGYYLKTRLQLKQSEISLKNTQPFRKALDESSKLVVKLDARERIIYCNDAFSRTVGWSQEELVDREFTPLLIDSSRRALSKQRFDQLISQAIKPGRYENKLKHRDGESLYVSWHESIDIGEGGYVEKILLIGDNTTLSRKEEEHLNIMVAAVEQSPATVMLTNPGGLIEYVNPKFCEVTEYSSAEVLGKRPNILKSGEVPIEVYQDLWKTISSGEVWHGVFHNRKKNGELFWEAASISPIRNHDGGITHYLAVKEDITEQRRLEELFHLAVESSPSSMIMIDESGEIVLVNSQAEKLFGYSRDELLGQTLEILVPERFRSNHSTQRQQIFNKMETREMSSNMNLSGRRKEGSEFPIDVGLNPVETEQGKLVLCSIVDLTEQRKMEEKLDARNQEIAKAQSLAALGQMAAMIAHDLRNPLSSVKMGLQILGKHKTEKDEGHELRKIGLEQVNHMERIISDLLSYARPSGLKPVWLDVRKVIENVILLSEKQIKEHKISLKVWHPSSLPTLFGDRDKLQQLFSNLLANSIQATENLTDEENGRIEISTHLDIAIDPPRIRIEIVDNGDGIAPNELDKIFEPFHTTRAKGTGLGLAIVKQIIDQHGGEVFLEAEAAGETRTIVILPTHQSDADETTSTPTQR